MVQDLADSGLCACEHVLTLMVQISRCIGSYRYEMLRHGIYAKEGGELRSCMESVNSNFGILSFNQRNQLNFLIWHKRWSLQ